MATPTIVYNASTGSNTAASGAGPSTAVTGTNGDIVASGSTLTLNETKDLTGVADDGGSDALFVDSTSGDRKICSISSFTGGKATCTAIVINETFDSTESGINWAVGGKRLHMEYDTTNEDWLDALAGWTYEFEEGTYTITQEINPTNGDRATGPVTFQAASGASPVFDHTTNIRSFKLDGATARVVIDGLKFTRSSGSWAGSAGVMVFGSIDLLWLRNCEFDGTGMGYPIYLASDCNALIEYCEVYSSDADGMVIAAGSRSENCIRHCSVHDNVEDGIVYGNMATFTSASLHRCVIYDNGKEGNPGNGVTVGAVLAGGQNRLDIIHCTIDGNFTDGIDVAGTVAVNSLLVLEGNSISHNGGYGLDTTTTNSFNIIGRNNNYYSNTSGARNNASALPDDTTIDPAYTSRTDGSEDFTPASGSGLIDGGAADRTA